MSRPKPWRQEERVWEGHGRKKRASSRGEEGQPLPFTPKEKGQGRGRAKEVAAASVGRDTAPSPTVVTSGQTPGQPARGAHPFPHTRTFKLSLARPRFLTLSPRPSPSPQLHPNHAPHQGKGNLLDTYTAGGRTHLQKLLKMPPPLPCPPASPELPCHRLNPRDGDLGCCSTPVSPLQQAASSCLHPRPKEIPTPQELENPGGRAVSALRSQRPQGSFPGRTVA